MVTKFIYKTQHALRKILLAVIFLYQKCVSPYSGQHCRFYPSCSEYAKEAIRLHSFTKGLFFTVRRILRCHPWHAGGVDPVPTCEKNHGF